MNKGLSPLVATIMLIAFTVLGGVLIYEFFTKTSESLMSSGETLIVTATKSYYDSSRSLVSLDIVNGHRVDVKITGFSYITSSDTMTTTPTTAIYGGSSSSLQPGAKHTAVIIVPNDVKAIIIHYEVKGQSLVKTVTLG